MKIKMNEQTKATEKYTMLTVAIFSLEHWLLFLIVYIFHNFNNVFKIIFSFGDEVT